jgi:hypothetical protein
MKSKEVAVAFGIPQGSVLEPMLQYFPASDIIMETILQISTDRNEIGLQIMELWLAVFFSKQLVRV